MGVKTTAIVTWECDRCAKKVEQKEMPSSPADPWGKLHIDQPSGFDMSGAPWCPRMREPILLCGACVEEIVAVVNTKKSIANAGKGSV